MILGEPFQLIIGLIVPMVGVVNLEIGGVGVIKEVVIDHTLRRL